MRLLIVAALLIAALPAHAVDTSVLVYGGSYHFDGRGRHESKYNLNERNPGVGLEFSQDGWLIGAGTYRDSYREQRSRQSGLPPWLWLRRPGRPAHGRCGLRSCFTGSHCRPRKVNSGGVVAFWLRYQF